MRWLAIALLFALFSGCVAEESDPLLAPELSSIGPGGSSDNQTDDEEGPVDVNGTETVTNVTADWNVTLVANNTTGPAPLAVAFTLDGGTNGSARSWTIDFADGNVTNGTDLP